MYREITPSRPLRAAIACYWFSREGSGPRLVRPDGCTDILLRRDAASATFRAEIVGTMSRARVVPVSGDEDIVGVRFHPGEAARFLGVAARDGRDATILLSDVSVGFSRELEETFSEAAIATRFDVLDRLLAPRLALAKPPDRRVRRAVDWLRAGARPQAIEEAIGARHLRRLFDDHVGVGPALFSRIFRLERAIDLRRRHPQRSFRVLAHQVGYSDASHLGRDFRALLGTTPEVFAQSLDVRNVPRGPDEPT